MSPVALEQARAFLQQSPDPARRRYAAETDADLLRVLGVVTPNGGLTPAGELAGLVERGALVRTSEARRGPTVPYGPGPAFPARRTRTADQRSRPTSAGR